MLIQYQKNIDSSMRRINALKDVEKWSIEGVRYWSGIYDSATIDVNELSSMLSTISTQYDYSVRDRIRVQRINTERDEEYVEKMKTYMTDSYTLSSFRERRESSMSSLNGWMEISSFKQRELTDALSNLETVTVNSKKSQEQIDIYVAEIGRLKEEKQKNSTDLFIQSSLLKKSEIELEDYLTDILDSINNQEWSTYEYRQTYCQELGVNYQHTYHSLVLGAVQYASTQNGLNAAFGGAPVAPIPVNLNTVQLSNAYLSLTNLNTFTTSFNTIFTEYNKQSSNIAAMSTTIGYEYIYWANFQESSIALLSENTPYVQGLVSTSLGAFESSAKAFTDASGVVYSQIETIAAVKNNLYKTYSTFFTPAQIAAQDDTISSFIMKGMQEASTLLTIDDS